MNNMKKTSPSRNSTERHDFVNHDDHDDHDKTENSLGVIRSQMDTKLTNPDNDSQTKPSSIKKKKHSNPFGSAKPREEVLARKGIDYHIIDDRIQKKASVPHFSRIQESHLNKLQEDLTKAEQLLRKANEQELPEEQLQIVVDEKRRSFNDLVATYKRENEEGRNDHMRFARPSERRRRRFDQNRNDETRYQRERGRYDDEDFAFFHRRDRLPDDERHHHIN